MKLLLIALLFTTNLYAQHFITIDNPVAANSQIEADSKEKACERLIKVLDKKKWLKGSWSLIELGSECSRTKQLDGPSLLDEAMEFVGLSGELEYYHPENFSLVYEDKTAEIADRQLDAAIDAKFACAKKAIKFIAKKNVSKGLSKAKIKKMVKDYQDAFMLLEAGAVETAIDEINGLSVNGTDITAQDKTDIVAFLNNCE